MDLKFAANRKRRHRSIDFGGWRHETPIGQADAHSEFPQKRDHYRESDPGKDTGIRPAGSAHCRGHSLRSFRSCVDMNAHEERSSFRLRLDREIFRLDQICDYCLDIDCRIENTGILQG